MESDRYVKEMKKGVPGRFKVGNMLLEGRTCLPDYVLLQEIAAKSSDF